MGTVGRLRYWYLAYFSKPVADRIIYRTIRRRKLRKILEIGIAGGERAVRMIEVARGAAGAEAIRYVAIDLFEARPKDAAGLSLKEAHRLLKSTGAQVQLIPGEAAQAVARSANALAQMDLIMISAGVHDDPGFAPAWFYLPRMLHANSHVYLESRADDGQAPIWRPVSVAEINALAGPSRRSRAA